MSNHDLTSSLQSAAAFIRDRDHFLVVSHVNPDGDAISSTLAVGLLLQYMGKHYTLVNENSIADKFKELPGGEHIQMYADSFPQFQYVITVDCADFSRVGRVQSGFSQDVEILNIDHHPTNDGFGQVNLIHTSSASTTQIVFELSNALDIKLTEELATCLYTGLMTDTGGFRYSNTTPEVMKIASLLLNAGVMGHQLAEKYLERLTLAHVRLLQRVLNSLSFSPDNKICWLAVTELDIEVSGAGSDDLEGLVNYPRNIDGVEIGILFKQIKENEIKVSLRSSGDVDVSKIAQSFGGGGHVKASGCTINDTLNEAIESVLQKLQQSEG